MQRNLWILFAIISLVTFGCKKNETAATDTATTDTYASNTSTTATDTSAMTSTTGTSAALLSDADKTFMNTIAVGGMAEVTLGQLAASKGTDQGVKDFGNRMVTDHGKAGDELKALASTKGVTLPSDLDAESKKTSDALSKKTGKAFDKAYISDMVKGHEKVVAAFEKESKAAKDPDLKTWVTNTLPTIQDHLKMAKEIESKLR